MTISESGKVAGGDSLRDKSIRLLRKHIAQHDPQDPFIYLTLDEADGILRALAALSPTEGMPEEPILVSIERRSRDQLMKIFIAYIDALRSHAARLSAQVAGLKEERDHGPDADVWAELHRLRAAVKGPDGFETWQDAATAERIRRVAAESALATARREALEEVKIRDALVTLVRLKDLKEWIEAGTAPDDRRAQYESEKEPAWEAARLALEAIPSPLPVQPSQARVEWPEEHT